MAFREGQPTDWLGAGPQVLPIEKADAPLTHTRKEELTLCSSSRSRKLQQQQKEKSEEEEEEEEEAEEPEKKKKKKEEEEAEEDECSPCSLCGHPDHDAWTCDHVCSTTCSHTIYKKGLTRWQRSLSEEEEEEELLSTGRTSSRSGPA